MIEPSPSQSNCALLDPVEALYARPGFMIRRAHQIAVALFLSAAGGRTTTTQYGALVVMSATPKLDQIGLSRLLGVDRSTSALVVRKLEAVGHLRCEADAQDRRRKTLKLTCEGARMLEDLAGPAEEARRALIDALSPAEGARLLRLLERFVAGFNAEARAPVFASTSPVRPERGVAHAYGTLSANAAQPRLAQLYRRPGFLLRRAHQISVSLFLTEMGAEAITTTQYGVLVILRHCEGLDQLTLSKKVGLDRTTTALVVGKLEVKGLALRVADPADCRRKVIVLTGRGERTLEAQREPAARARARALSNFDAVEAHDFLTSLTKLVAHFNQNTRAPINHGAGRMTVST